jgi:hypothetical protein
LTCCRENISKPEFQRAVLRSLSARLFFPVVLFEGIDFSNFNSFSSRARSKSLKFISQVFFHSLEILTIIVDRQDVRRLSVATPLSSFETASVSPCRSLRNSLISICARSSSFVTVATV